MLKMLTRHVNIHILVFLFSTLNLLVASEKHPRKCEAQGYKSNKKFLLKSNLVKHCISSCLALETTFFGFIM